jgi:putative NIF3 family GTP cyclohydrolase 1 type 2
MQLAQKLNLEPLETRDEFIDCFTMNNFNLNLFIDNIENVLERQPVIINKEKLLPKEPKIALCTGKAQDKIMKAKELKADIFITGEISENTVYLSEELDIMFISIGHYVSEQFGVIAIGELLKKQFDIEHQFIQVFNNV